jgi:Ca2+-binding RTX toxin-like protein
MRRCLLALTVLALLALAPAAQAASVSISTASEKVKVKGRDGETNRIVLGQIGDVVTIEDAGAPLSIASGEGCSGDAARVTCTLPSARYRLQVDGGDGDDHLSAATTSATTLSGEDGDDVLTGGDASDELLGGPGDDTLTGGGGADVADGGAGDDVVRSRDGVRDEITCDLGADTGEADLEDAITGECPAILRPLSTSALDGAPAGGDRDGAPALPAELAALPAPDPGASVSGAVRKGDVRIKLPGARTYTALDPDRPVPVGATVDARRGLVTLVAAKDLTGGRQVASFTGGVFTVSQSRAAVMTTVLTLRGGDFSRCTRSRRTTARAAASKRIRAGKRVRRLWGSGHGRFTTRGRNSTASVRGTVWSVTDTCLGTLTRVERGAVAVRDLGRRRTTLVRAGREYLARRAAARRR